MTRGGDLTVGIDIGTTSVKAVAAAADGTVVARARVPHRGLSATATDLRHDAARAWRRAPRRALAALGDVQPRAISVAGMVPSLTAVNARGVPLTSGYLYGDAAGGDATTELTGGTPGFLATLARDCPEAAGFWPAQTTAVVSLGGPPVVGGIVAMVMAPLAENGRWNPDVLRSCDVPADRLPRIVADHTPVAEVDGAVLDAGSIDVMCERLVAGDLAPGDAIVICGSTLIVIVRLPDGQEAPGLQTFPDGDGWAATSASNAGGLFLDWVDRVIGPGDGVVRPADVPVWSPYIRGERTPWHDPFRRASLVGLHLGHDRAAIRRAAYEASAFVVRHHLELAGGTTRRIVATGGGTAVPGWMAALADCTGIPVEVSAVTEGAALGAAFVGRVTAGLETDLAAAAGWARTARTVEPRAGWAAAATERYATFRRLAEGVS